ncbi:MAG: diaminopropionate ammonia-lyase [Coriobacteriales bacterium]|nr:diaminopropionate ammonia-lyase [Coriobacteriales bacterium]
MDISRREFVIVSGALMCSASLFGLTSCNSIEREIKTENINVLQNDNYQKNKPEILKDFSVDVAKSANKFLSSFPNYQETPLLELNNLAKDLGVAGIYVKDESKRFDLNAFKVNGASFAMGTYIASRINKDINDMNYEEMVSPAVKKELGELTFITATDGNHGRAVAWTANKLGQKAVVYMPKGSSEERLNNIKAEGADASILQLSYDDCVRKAQSDAQKNGWILVQDTALEGYTDIPTKIMQGYTNIWYEILNQVANQEFTHVFLQAGVGSFSGALTATISNYCDEKGIHIPKFIIVEPNGSNCIYKTAYENNGKLQTIKNDMTSIMAGLNCGEPSPIAWDILNNYTYRYCSISDEITKIGMRVLAKPHGNDTPIVSGESGACTLGFAYETLHNKDLSTVKESLELDSNSRILCISTEGNTDQASYNAIVNAN